MADEDFDMVDVRVERGGLVRLRLEWVDTDVARVSVNVRVQVLFAKRGACVRLHEIGADAVVRVRCGCGCRLGDRVACLLPS